MNDFEDWSGTAFSTDDGAHNGLCPSVYVRQQPTEQEMIAEHFGVSMAEALRIMDAGDAHDRGRRAWESEHV